jgi:DNA-binding response OmpR family regulator
MSVEEGREFLAPFFEQSAHQMRVKVAFNLREGYLKADLLQPELILLKVSMPVMDGFATCPVLKYNERTHHISVIFQSAASKVVRCIEGLALDADTMPSTAIACTFVPHTALPLYPRTDLRKWLGHSG